MCFMDLASEVQVGEMTSPRWGRHLKHSKERGELRALLLPSHCSLSQAFEKSNSHLLTIVSFQNKFQVFLKHR